MVTHASPFVPVRADGQAEDRRFVLYGVDWDTYEALRKDGTLSVLELESDAYVPRTNSAVLPALDLELLCRFVEGGASQSAQVRAYRAALRGAIAST